MPKFQRNFEYVTHNTAYQVLRGNTMTSIPTEDTDRPTMAPINQKNLAYKLALDSAIQTHAARVAGVEIRERKYIQLEMTVLDSTAGLPTHGAETVIIEMPVEYMPDYNPRNN